VLIKGDIG